jgi:hypothetical protein
LRDRAIGHARRSDTADVAGHAVGIARTAAEAILEAYMSPTTARGSKTHR